MQATLNIVVAIALLIVVVILGLGLWNMMRGGSSNTSQKLMRLRVIAQAVALVLLLAALYFAGGQH